MGGEVADWVAAIGSSLSFVIAVLVYFEAKRIQKNESFRNLIDLWDQYNRIQIETGFYAKYGDFYQFKCSEKKLNEEYVMVIWGLFNVLQFTWSSLRDGILPDFYSRHQATSWFFLLKPRREFFLAFMDENGADPAFRNLVATITSATDMEDAKRVMNLAYSNRRQRRYF